MPQRLCNLWQLGETSATGIAEEDNILKKILSYVLELKVRLNVFFIFPTIQAEITRQIV